MGKYTQWSISYKKEENSDTWYNMNEPEDLMLREISKHKMTNTVWVHLYGVPRVVKFIETENRMVDVRGGRGEWGDID